ncbi:MAG: hypothetical protein GY701_08205 [Sulfitobacter sp.]|nr:hypothetical protein [Sulfitobacter sp.]MCP3938654.1 hypothetical protein [Actinomycetes bacterium]
MLQRFDEDTPGQLGAFGGAGAAAGESIGVFCSDRDRQVIVTVDDIEAEVRVSSQWTANQKRQLDIDSDGASS